VTLKRADVRQAVNDDFSQRENLQPQKKELLNQRIFRISDTDYKSLKKHFEEKGLSISGGIRMIVKEYLKNN